MTGQPPPWTEFFDKEYERLRRWAEARMGSQVRAAHGASDIVSTAIGRVVQKGTEELPSDLATLVCVVRKRIVWAIIDKSRRSEARRTATVAPTELERLFQVPLEDCDPADLLRLEDSLDALTIEERQLVVLRHEWGFGYREIAEQIAGLTESSARHACDQALALLRREFLRRR